MFKYDKCGQCCRNLHKSPIYAELHNGDGVCKFLKGNICSIYETRPVVCRIDESYDVFFKELMRYEEYLQRNYECCEILREEKGEKLCHCQFG